MKNITNNKIAEINLGTAPSQKIAGKSMVPNNLGFIRHKIISGRVYYYWVIHTTDRRRKNPDKQKNLAYLGSTLPHGLRLGRVTPEMVKIINRILKEKTANKSR